MTIIKRDKMYSHINLGASYYAMGRFVESIAENKKALEIAGEIGDIKGKHICLHNLGGAHWGCDRFSEAISLFEKAIEMAHKSGHKLDEVKYLDSLGVAYRNLGQLKKAEKCHLQALEIAQKAEFKHGQVQCLNNLGIAYRWLCHANVKKKKETSDEIEKALNFHLEGLSIAKNIGAKNLEGDCLNSLGLIYFDLGYYDEAISNYYQGLKIAQNNGEELDEAIIFSNLAMAYREKGLIKESLELYDKALPIFRKISDTDRERINEFHLGQIAEENLNDPCQAYKHYHRSITIIEELRLQVNQLNYRQTVLERKIDVYKQMICLCIKMDKKAAKKLQINAKEEAFNYLERAKSRTFIELLSGQAKKKDDISSFQDTPITFTSMKKFLEPKRKTAVVEYFTTEEKVFIFIIRLEDSEPIIKEANIKELQIVDCRKQMLSDFSIRLRPSKPFSVDLKYFYELSEELVFTFLEYVSEYDILYLVPHGWLHYLPLHALKCNDDQYLAEKFKIVYSQSASVISYCQSKYTKLMNNKNNSNILNCLSLGVGKLDDTQEVKMSIMNEAKEIGEVIFKSNRYCKIDKEASKNYFINNCKEKDIIYLATHGFFDELDPLCSGILLSNGERLASLTKEGGRVSVKPEFLLSAREIFELHFNAELIAMSACVTGINDVRPGDELIGLARALICAGTPTVLVTLWNVNTHSCMEFMKTFFRNLITPDGKKKMSKVEAFQKTQISFFQNETNKFWRHPYHWAPFVLIGDWD